MGSNAHLAHRRRGPNVRQPAGRAAKKRYKRSIDEPQSSISQPSSTTPQKTIGTRRDRARLTAAAILGGLLAIFAILNLGDVSVNWIVASGQTPLILVIVIAFLLGIAVDRLLLVRARRKRRSLAESDSAGTLPSA
jgi:uncharacterized integral membrane protein